MRVLFIHVVTLAFSVLRICVAVLRDVTVLEYVQTPESTSLTGGSGGRVDPEVHPEEASESRSSIALLTSTRQCHQRPSPLSFTTTTPSLTDDLCGTLSRYLSNEAQVLHWPNSGQLVQPDSAHASHWPPLSRRGRILCCWHPGRAAHQSHITRSAAGTGPGRLPRLRKNPACNAQRPVHRP
jgi:hypothetical protein